MRILGNIIWMVFGGFLTALQYVVGGALLILTVVLIPFGLQMIKMGRLCLLPFGVEVRRKDPAETGCMSTALNCVWLVVTGWYICLLHLFFGALFYITVVGIPFARQHFKLAKMGLTPFSYELV